MAPTWTRGLRHWLLDEPAEHPELDEEQAREHVKPLGNVTVLKDKADREGETHG